MRHMSPVLASSKSSSCFYLYPFYDVIVTLHFATLKQKKKTPLEH